MHSHFNPVFYLHPYEDDIYASRPPPNMNWIREMCNSLGKDLLTSFVGNHLAAAGLRENSTLGKEGNKSNPLFACTGLKSKLC